MVSRSPEEEKFLLITIARVVIVRDNSPEYISPFGEMQMSSNDACTFLDTVALSFRTLIRSRET